MSETIKNIINTRRNQKVMEQSCRVNTDQMEESITYPQDESTGPEDFQGREQPGQVIPVVAYGFAGEIKRFHLAPTLLPEVLEPQAYTGARHPVVPHAGAWPAEIKPAAGGHHAENGREQDEMD